MVEKRSIKLNFDDLKQFKRELKNIISIHTNIQISMINQRDQAIEDFIMILLKIEEA